MTEVSDEMVYALFFKMMANKDRLKIMNSLSDHPKTVTQLCNDTGFEQTWVSHSLKLLKEKGMVEARREGKYIYYKLDRGVKPVITAASTVAYKYHPSTRGGE